MPNQAVDRFEFGPSMICFSAQFEFGTYSAVKLPEEDSATHEKHSTASSFGRFCFLNVAFLISQVHEGVEI
ncbi:hypothetical protein Ddye_030305 [Dipteronia dyeriana]|uniref:Uncharacterized protein n=1 Tax=Dipteronia dyeriana TaxID=168575 RepID=A0AAD9TH50_9ROSI|nr:hypothetical protein Ddye_030305 [Dipteronia dyeriana]